MPSHAAFLRGINVGAHHRVGGAELRALFEGIGLAEPATFRTSGNVVFGAGRESAPELTGRIERALEEALGYPVQVFLRSEDEIRAMAGHEPFERELVEASKGKLQVSFLLERPPAAARKEVLALATDEDRLAFGDRELYWLPSGGTQKSALDLRAIERRLGQWTMRTKGTVDLMAAKYFPG